MDTQALPWVALAKQHSRFQESIARGADFSRRKKQSMTNFFIKLPIATAMNQHANLGHAIQPEKAAAMIMVIIGTIQANGLSPSRTRVS